MTALVISGLPWRNSGPGTNGPGSPLLKGPMNLAGRVRKEDVPIGHVVQRPSNDFLPGPGLQARFQGGGDIRPMIRAVGQTDIARADAAGEAVLHHLAIRSHLDIGDHRIHREVDLRQLATGDVDRVSPFHLDGFQVALQTLEVLPRQTVEEMVARFNVRSLLPAAVPDAAWKRPAAVTRHPTTGTGHPGGCRFQNGGPS